MGIPDPGIIGGLVLEHATRARDEPHRSASDRRFAVQVALNQAVRAALSGNRPQARVTTLPRWVQTAAVGSLADDFPAFHTVRMLELSGLVELEPDETYVSALLSTLSFDQAWLPIPGWADGPRNTVEWFAWDSALIERAYWPAYTLDPPVDRSFRVGGRYGALGWAGVTLAMIERGLITRDRVIVESLAALGRDIVSATARYYVDLLTRLTLCTADVAQHQPALRHLMSVEPAVTLTFALARLEEVNQAGLLDDEATATALAAALTGRTKVLAMAALRLLDQIHRRTPSADVVTATRAGLDHRHVDVQRRSARLLRLAGGSAALEAEVDRLDFSVRRELDLPTVPTTDGQVVDVGFTPAPAREPVRDRDLAERLAALMEQADDPYEVELVLDRLARPGAGVLIEPLITRAAAICRSGGTGDHGSSWLAGHLARLVVESAGLVLDVPAELNRIFGGAEPSERARFAPQIEDELRRFPAAQVPAPETPLSLFLFHRLREVGAVLMGRRAPGTLLATPTEPCGWVEGGAFLARLGTAVDVGGPPRFDLLNAVLRLAPEGRREARDKLRRYRLPEELDAALRHALGGRTRIDTPIGDVPLWVAASRARGPLADDPVLIAAELDSAGLGRGIEGSVLGYRPRRGPWSTGTSTGYLVSMAHPTPDPASRVVDAEPAWVLGGQLVSELPTAMSDLRIEIYPARLEPWLGWAATIWPHDAEHIGPAALTEAFFASAWPTFHQTDAMSALERHQGRLGLVCFAALAVALQAASVEGRVHAADATAGLLARGRVSSADLGSGLAAVGNVAVLPRWADSLRLVAEAGHGVAVIEALSVLVASVPVDTRGLHAVLGLLYEELLRVGGRAQPPELRAGLARFAGSSQAARTARKLLAL